MSTSFKSKVCLLLLLIAAILPAAVVEGCSCGPSWGDTPAKQAEFILNNETYGPDITMYAIATLVIEITFSKNAEDMGYEPYDYDDDGNNNDNINADKHYYNDDGDDNCKGRIRIVTLLITILIPVRVLVLAPIQVVVTIKIANF